MRKFNVNGIILPVMLFVFAASAFAVKADEDGGKTAENVSDAKTLIADAIAQRKDTVDVSGLEISQEEYKAVFSIIEDEEYLYYAANSEISLKYNTDLDKEYISIEYGIGLEEYEERFSTLSRVVSDYTQKKIDGQMCDYAKAVLAHEYVIGKGQADNEVNADAYDLFKNKKASSEGYAKAYKLLMDAAEIPCRIVYEKNGKEAVNLVEIENNLYYVDVFSDDLGKMPSHMNLLTGEKEFKSNHRKWKESYGASKESYQHNPFRDVSVTVGRQSDYLVAKLSDKTIRQDTKYPNKITNFYKPVIKKVVTPKSGTVRIKWSKMCKNAEYVIYRAEKKNGKYKKVKTVKGVLKFDIKAENGKKYYYKVVAKRDGVKLKSSAKSATATVPKTKITSVDFVGGSIFKIKFNKVEDADKYVVYGSNSKNGKYTEIDKTDKDYYYVNSDMYKFFKVKALDENGKNKAYSKFSNTVTAVI